MDGMPAMIMTFRIVMIELYEMTKWLNFSIWYGRRHIIDGPALSSTVEFHGRRIRRSNSTGGCEGGSSMVDEKFMTAHLVIISNSNFLYSILIFSDQT